jgi:hypothetical protein
VQTKRDFRLYLLGYPEREDWHSLEAGWFANSEEFEQLAMAEEELIDDYVFGLLSAEDSARFERHFLCSPKRREKVANSRALRQYAQANVEISSAFRFQNWRFFIPGRKWVLILSTACIFLVLTFVYMKHLRTDRSIASISAPASGRPSAQPAFASGAQITNNETEALDSRPSESNEHTSFGRMGVAIMLSPGLTRGDGTQERLTMPADAHFARFTLKNPNAQEGKLKEELLLSTEEVTVWSNEVSLTAGRARSGKLSLDIPGRFLQPDDYQIKLSQVDPTGKWSTIVTYSFRVTRAK